MYSIWTKHLKDQEEKAQYEKSLRNAKWVLDDISKILKTLEEELDRVELNPKFYELPNWEYRQADNIGYRRCLNLVKKLINLDQKETNDRPSTTSG